DLPHVGAVVGEGELLELLAARIEGPDRVAAEVADPDAVTVVDVHGVDHGVAARHLPGAPAVRRRVVHGDLAGVPLAHPDAPAAVTPDAPRALAARGRLHDARFAGAPIDMGDEGAGQRAPPDLARGRRADAVGA